jgi:hypothetical protein
MRSRLALCPLLRKPCGCFVTRYGAAQRRWAYTLSRRVASAHSGSGDQCPLHSVLLVARQMTDVRILPRFVERDRSRPG